MNALVLGSFFFFFFFLSYFLCNFSSPCIFLFFWSFLNLYERAVIIHVLFEWVSCETFFNTLLSPTYLPREGKEGEFCFFLVLGCSQVIVYVTLFYCTEVSAGDQVFSWDLNSGRTGPWVYHGVYYDICTLCARFYSGRGIESTHNRHCGPKSMAIAVSLLLSIILRSPSEDDKSPSLN